MYLCTELSGTKSRYAYRAISMKLYLICGEDSGDLHAANLVAAARRLHPNLLVRGVGGDRLLAQGMEQVAHVRDINFMGFVEVAKNLRTIKQLFRTVENDIRAWQPDAVVLVDYPGFNMRLMPFIKQLNISIVYYISPQLWAWKKGRIEKVRQYVDRMYVILPFEQEFYAKEGIRVEFLGHPLLDAMDTTEATTQAFPKGARPLVALLPGSRAQEISRMLPVMLRVAAQYPQYDFVVAGAPSRSEAFYAPFLQGSAATLVMNKTYDVLQRADAALVTSGTATLETALHGVPQVVCYKGSWISYQIGKRLVDVKYISLVNLIADQAIVRELIQTDFTEKEVAASLEALFEAETRQQILAGYDALYALLGNRGASGRIAADMLQFLGWLRM